MKKISETLLSVALWLENPNNEVIVSSENNDECLKIVAESCVLAAEILKKAATQVVDLEDGKLQNSIEALAEVATCLDQSDDPNLQKQASVLDELLFTIATPPQALANRLAESNSRLEELKKKYNTRNQDNEENSKIADTVKEIEKSPYYKEYRIMEAPLQTRTCPDHPGAQMARVEENMFQCELDKKIYNYEAGYTLNNGQKVPGGSVTNQISGVEFPFTSLFDSREGRLNSNKP